MHEYLMCLCSSYVMDVTLSETATFIRLQGIHEYISLNTRYLLLQLSLKEDDDVTPVTLLHNVVGHLYGPSRPLGAVMCGYSGIRTFEPQVMYLLLV